MWKVQCCILLVALAVPKTFACEDGVTKCIRRPNQHDICSEFGIEGEAMHAQCRFTPLSGQLVSSVSFSYTVAEPGGHIVVEYDLPQSCSYLTKSPRHGSKQYICQARFNSINTTNVKNVKCVVQSMGKSNVYIGIYNECNEKITGQQPLNKSSVIVKPVLTYPSLQWNFTNITTSEYNSSVEVIKYPGDTLLRAECTVSDPFEGLGYTTAWVLEDRVNSSNIITLERYAGHGNGSIHLSLNKTFTEEHNHYFLKCVYFRGSVTLEKTAILEIRKEVVPAPAPAPAAVGNTGDGGNTLWLVLWLVTALILLCLLAALLIYWCRKRRALTHSTKPTPSEPESDDEPPFTVQKPQPPPIKVITPENEAVSYVKIMRKETYHVRDWRQPEQEEAQSTRVGDPGQLPPGCAVVEDHRTHGQASFQGPQVPQVDY